MLDRLQTAAAGLDASAEPDEVARRAANLALRLTRSSHAELDLGESKFSASGDAGRMLRQSTATADLRAGEQVLGTLRVSRSSPYADSERSALAIFASQAATAIDSSRRLRSTERV